MTEYEGYTPELQNPEFEELTKGWFINTQEISASALRAYGLRTEDLPVLVE